MAGIRESRKKVQRTIDFIKECSKPDAALHELRLLRASIDRAIDDLAGTEEPNSDAPDSIPPTIVEEVRMLDEGCPNSSNGNGKGTLDKCPVCGIEYPDNVMVTIE